MLFILFILPEYLRKYEVRIDSIPQLCKYRIVVSKRGTPVDSTNFIYSIDGGKHYQHLNEFKIDSLKNGIVIVKPDSGMTRVKEIKNTFSNPFLFKPLCQQIDPCDCNGLKITVDEEPVLSTKNLVIHTNRPKCTVIEYSITGESGPFQKDNVFADIKKPGPYKIYIKTAKCTIAFDKNPYLVTIPKKAPVQQIAAPSVNYFEYNEVDEGPFLPKFGSNTKQEIDNAVKKGLADISISGTYYIDLKINTSGTASVHISGPDQNVCSRIEQIIRDEGDWSPGTKNNGFVNTHWRFPITF